MTWSIWYGNYTLRLNLYCPFLVTQVFLPAMREKRYGRIDSITLAMANFVFEGLGAYSAAKSGL